MAACDRCDKVAHIDQAAAKAAMSSLVAATGSTRLNVYPCPYGNGWHVGHSRGTLTRDLKRLRRQQAAIKAAAKGARRRHRR